MSKLGKKIFALQIGQSNEVTGNVRDIATWDTETTGGASPALGVTLKIPEKNHGMPRRDSVFWMYLDDELNRLGIDFAGTSRGLGGTGWWNDWCGSGNDNTGRGTTYGDTASAAYNAFTHPPRRYTETGWDPRNLIGHATSGAQAFYNRFSKGSWDERWVFMQNAHEDMGDLLVNLATNAERIDYYAQGILNIVEYWFENNPTLDGIAIGLSGAGSERGGSAFTANYNNFMVDGWLQGIARAKAAYPNKQVIAGGNVYAYTARGASDNTNSPAGAWVHFTTPMAKRAAEAWVKALRIAGFI